MTAYYNEVDPHAAAWLRNLITAGHIAPGEVDERSIEDVAPTDLAGFDQCHFFAGIGVWSYALRQAGWSDDRAIWTGSCPCQPFSAAGKGDGVADERHLWPAWFWLIDQCRPDVIVGEQVEAAIKHGWLDLVQSDLEGIGYAVCPVGLPAAGVGAPHIRGRAWFVADAQRGTAERHRHTLGGAARGVQGEAYERQWIRPDARDGGDARRMADAASSGSRTGLRDHGSPEQRRVQPADGGSAGALAHAGGTGSSQLSGQWDEPAGSPTAGVDGGMADAASFGRQHGPALARGDGARTQSTEQREEFGVVCGFSALADASNRLVPQPGWGSQGRNGIGPASADDPAAIRATNGHWRDADWIACRDGKWRPVEPGTFPLAHGIAGRVGRLRGYGNAIVAPVATAFISAFMEAQK